MKKNINNIKEKLSVHKSLIQNFSYLSALQAFNMLIPLITYPYLIRIIGKETYGLVVFAQAIIQYLVILIEFGFNISATKEVSIHRDNKKKLSEVVSSVLIIKGAFFLGTVIILSILVFLLPQANDHKALFYLSMWACLYNVIFPIWYFQGIEKMKFITYITLISRIPLLGLVFVFIHSPDDFLFIPILNGIGALLAGIVSIYIIFKQHRVRFKIQTIKSIYHYLKESFPLFISSFSIQLYLATNKILAGMFLGFAEIAYYDLGEKILKLFKLPIRTVSQVIFPKMSKTYNKTFLKKTILFVFIIVLIGIIIFQFIVEDFIILFAGRDMLPAVNVSRILIISLLPLIISNGLGIQILLSKGYNKQYGTVVIYTTFFYFILAFGLIVSNQITIYTLPVINVLIEIFMLIGFFKVCRKLKLI